MATLINTDYQIIVQLIRNDTDIRSVFKVWSLSKQNWKDLFQACENYFVGAFNTRPATSFSAALDVVVSTTSVQAKWIWKIWSAWRLGITW
jgi:hypothetical protein